MRRYGKWAYKGIGAPEDPARCFKEVWAGDTAHQCRRKRGHGPDGLYCRQHAARIEAARERKEEGAR